MNDKIKKELEAYTVEELISLLDSFCTLTEAESKLELLVLPNIKLIKREVSSFDRWCQSYERNPTSDRALNQLYNISKAVFRSIVRLVPKDKASILYDMYKATDLDFDCCDLDAICDIRNDILQDLYDTVNQNRKLFTEPELSRYDYIFDEYF